MRILFIHQNFPGQFKHLAPALAANSANQVVALATQQRIHDGWQNIRLVRYQPTRGTSPNIHPWVTDFETKVIYAEAAFRAMMKLRDDGFSPDLVIAHPGWGESLFVKDVWPDTTLAMYGEFYYHARGADVGFDPEFAARDPGDVCRLRLKNTSNLLHFQTADAGLSPTRWQASTFPPPFRDRITVIHDGIDTGHLKPFPGARLTLRSSPDGPALKLTRDDEVITFVCRSLEPYRGYHRFMRALPEILRRRPKARVLLVGDDGVTYGARPPQGRKWKDIFLDEVRDQLDLSRVHFLGQIPYANFITLLQLSRVHVYLTYPFVLSWSLIEAMSTGCAIVASDTTPLHEAIRHDDTGRLVGFFDTAGIANEVCRLLELPEERKRLGANARAFAQANYDLKTICLPRQLAWVEGLMAGKGEA